MTPIGPAHRKRTVHTPQQRTRAGAPSTDLVSAARARGHLLILTGQGATQKGLARAADLNVKTIREILEGGRTRIQPDTESIVLAITMVDVRQSHAPGTLIPAALTWERINDMVARGWPRSWKPSGTATSTRCPEA